jgi:anthranilate phosphoribosyltransferase
VPASPEPSPLHDALAALAARRALSEAQAHAAFGAVMRGEATAAQIAALLMGLRVKGETAEEVAGAARALREAMLRVEAHGTHLVDTCGTGGGTVPTFNISTAAAFVAAGAGAAVAKHGNRSFTSRCGSADVLEALGLPVGLGPEAAARALREHGMAFLFAPNYHPAMRFVAPVRRELGIATVMNLIGPLANPAGVRRQVVGVADPQRGPVVAEALRLLGAEHALVVHARVGMDEIAPSGPSLVWEVRGGELRTWELDPETLGLASHDLADLEGGDPPQNAKRVRRLLAEPARDTVGRATVLLNAGAALYVAGLADSVAQGTQRAAAALDEGAAAALLERLAADREISISA